MTFIAYEFLAKCNAGLQLSGVEDGQLQWMGTFTEWQRIEAEEMKLIWK